MQITKELQNTVKNHPLIKKVYFDEEGNHFFNVHEVEIHQVDENNVSTGTKKVKSLPGVIMGTVKLRKKVSGHGDQIIPTRVNVRHIPVEEEMTREEILAARPNSDGLSNSDKIKFLEQAKVYAEELGRDVVAKVFNPDSQSDNGGQGDDVSAKTNDESKSKKK